MKTRKQIIEEYASEGYTLGTFDDVKESINYVGENKLIFLSEDRSRFTIENVCTRYEGDFEDVDFVEYDKYRKTKKWKNLSKLVKEKAGNKCTFCKSTKRLVAHHHNYINLYNETEKDLICVCGQCHRKIHMGCSCFRDNDLCEVCKFSKENYTVMYNYLISDIRNCLGLWCERKQHIK